MYKFKRKVPYVYIYICKLHIRETTSTVKIVIPEKYSISLLEFKNMLKIQRCGIFLCGPGAMFVNFFHRVHFCTK